MGRQSAGGSSTCYISVDHSEKSLLLVNYWDSTMGVMPVMQDGAIAPLKTLTQPERQIAKVDAFEKRAAGKHDLNDESTQKQRQSEPHAHAIVQNLRVTEWENNIVRDICSNITKFVLRMDRELPFVALKEQRPMILVVRKNSFKDI